MHGKTDYLQAVEIFKDLHLADVEQINQQTTMVSYKAGHLFYMPNDPAEVLFILKQGHVQLYRILPDGRKLVIAVLGPGMIFGQMALVGQHLYNTFAEALDECLICVWSRMDIEQMVLQFPQIALRFLETMGQRLVNVEQRLEETTYKRIPARLAALLLRLDEENGSSGVVQGFTHQSLADMLGTYRETATQTLNEFKNQNLIRTGRKSIEIINGPGLKEIATL